MIKRILTLIATIMFLTSCVMVNRPYPRYFKYRGGYTHYYGLYGNMLNWYYQRLHYNKFYMRIVPQNIQGVYTKVYKNQLENKAVQHTTVKQETFEKQSKEKVKEK